MSTAELPHHFEASPNIGPLVVMGVSGCGKTSVGISLASSLGYRFVEGDSHHTPANVDRMRQGIALTDDDRWPWLKLLGSELAANSRTVMSCSALKRSYRNLIRHEAGRPMTFIFLQGSREALKARMEARQGHFMPTSLPESQFDTLELPTHERDVITIEIEQAVKRIAAAALAHTITLAERRST